MNPIEIPREITKYETKLIGPFTARQCAFYAVAIIVCLLVYNLTKAVIPDSALVIALFAAIPFVLVGTIKIYGMPLEKFAVGYFKTNLIAPMKRKTKIVNQFAIIDKEMEAVKQVEIKKEKNKYKKSKKAFK